MPLMFPVTMQSLFKNTPSLFRPDFFEIVLSRASGQHFKLVKPILQFPDGQVSLEYNVGVRTNGVDSPRWPEDLSVEIIS